MATSLAQTIEEQARMAELLEAEKMRQALLLSPPEGTDGYILTRDFFDSVGQLHREGSVLFFREGEAPASAKKVKEPKLVVTENVAVPAVTDFEARKEADPISVTVQVNGQTVTPTEGTATSSLEPDEDENVPRTATGGTTKSPATPAKK